MDEFAAHLIISNDAFIAATRASELFSALSADVADETSKEIIDASSSKADDAISAIDSSMSAARTFSLFGGKKTVWLRNVNFLSDGALGKSESLEKKLEELVEFLSGLRADEVAFVINASPVDKRKKFFDHESEPYKAARYLDRQITKRLPKKSATEEQIQNWAADIDKVNRIDGYDWDLIADVLEFCQKDPFWQNNILSGKKFREKFLQLMAKMGGTR